MSTLIQHPDGCVKSVVNCSTISHVNHFQIFSNKGLKCFPKHLPLSSIHYKNTCKDQRIPHGRISCASDSRFIMSAVGGNSNDSSKETAFEKDTDVFPPGIGPVSTITADDIKKLEDALNEANARAEAAEEGRDKAIDELGQAEVKLQEYSANIIRNTELAVSELEAAKVAFHQQLQKLLNDKMAVESKLVLAKQDAIDLAVQVEKFAEVAIQEATAHIVEEAKLRVSAAETSAADVTHQAEERLKNAVDNAASTVVTESKGVIDKSLAIAQVAREQANKAQAALNERLHLLDELVHSESSKISLQTTLHELQRQQKLVQNEVERLQFELKASEARLNAAEARAAASDKALLDIQESANKAALAQVESAKRALEVLKNAAAEREEAYANTFKMELESMQSAINASKKAESRKEEAYLRRCAALERALAAAEATANAWKERSRTAELLLQKTREGEFEDQETELVLKGGRVEFLIKDDAKKVEPSGSWSKKGDTRMDGSKNRLCLSKVPSLEA